MKLFLVSIALLGIAFSSAVEAKGCIKGAIVGGLAGHGRTWQSWRGCWMRYRAP